MKLLKVFSILLLGAGMMTSCVSKKKYAELEMSLEDCRTSLTDCQQTNSGLQTDLREVEDRVIVLQNDLANAENRNNELRKQLEYFKETNTNLLDRLSDLSVVSKSGAESIKKSLEALNEQNKYIKNLTSTIRVKDSLNLALVMNLKRSLANIDDEDVQIEVKKGVVYISLSDKMLFRSGSAVISQRAEEVMGKIANILKDHQQLDILVEGHTDNVPISTECIKDNWDLSVKRATSVVRLLQDKYGVKPSRMTAGGRSEFIPKATNETDEGRSLNRRTEIILLPKLDEFFSLLNSQPGQ